MPQQRHWGIAIRVADVAARAAGALCLALALGALGALGACGGKRVLGEQCPSPLTGEASVAELPDGGASPSTSLYGTSCAPCEDSSVEIDADGCPVYVTFESCGGDICVGSRRISLVPVDEDDAGVDVDAGGDTDARGDADGGAE